MIVRAISFIQNKFEREQIVKVMNRLEGFLYMGIPGASKNDIIEIIKHFSRIFNGGGFMFWKSLDQ